MAKDKAAMMRENRARRAEAGLVKVEVYIKPEQCQRLEKYVVGRLKGEYATRRKGN